MTIWMLYLVEFADWNSQKTIGKGCGNNSATENMGYTDSMPYHTGTTLASRDSYGLGTQYRYIEGLWDNVYDWGDGCYYNSNGLNIINTPSSFSDNSGGIAVSFRRADGPAHLPWQRWPVWNGLSIPRHRAGVRRHIRRITGASMLPTRVCASAVAMTRAGATGCSAWTAPARPTRSRSSAAASKNSPDGGVQRGTHPPLRILRPAGRAKG